MYESPINMIISKLYTNIESECMKAVQRCGFDVDKEELAKALKYDREQYEKGYMDGYKKSIDDFVQKVKEHQYVLSDVINSKDYGMFTIGIEQIAEQLKEGGNINE